jgi:hypothetical protein
MTTHCRRLFLLKPKEDKTHKKTIKKNQEKVITFKLLLCPFTFGSRFYPSISNAFCWHLFLFKQKKRKKNQETKIIEKNKKRREGKELTFQAFGLPFHFRLSLLPLCFKHFLLAFFSSQAKVKKRKIKKKNP